MNSKDLLSLARFFFVTIEDNDVVNFNRTDYADEPSVVSLITSDGVSYLIPDQETTFSTNLDGTIGPIKLQAIMPGRLLKDRDVEVFLGLHKLMPVTSTDVQEATLKAQKDPLCSDRELATRPQVNILKLDAAS
jgi:hypothetical protein